VNLFVSPIINQVFGGIQYVLWFGTALCLISVGSAIALAYLDLKGDRKLKVHKDSVIEEKIECRDILHFPLSFWLLVLICVTFYVTIFTFITISRFVFGARILEIY
jgi:hypothetical protein